MAQTECTQCNGTGWDSAARQMNMLDAPTMLRPLGVFPCNACGGTGKFGLTPELEEAIKAIRFKQPNIK